MEPSPIPTKPTPPPPRRGFFRWLTVGTARGRLGVRRDSRSSAICLKPKKRPIDWVDLGQVGDFAADETRMVTFDNPIRQPWDGMAAHTGVYVRNEGKDDQPEGPVPGPRRQCAHLGCPVSWFPQSGLFMCPCHGGVYYATGERASGPPPRGLFHCVWRVTRRPTRDPGAALSDLQDTLEQPADDTTT